MATTYYKISEQIRTLDAQSVASDDYRFGLRFIGELVADEVASQAWLNAIENSKMGETSYASDLFTSTFTNIAVTYSTTLKQYYSVLPVIPPALPNDQEIVSVTPYGIQSGRRQLVPMKSKDKFMQDLIGETRVGILFRIENGNLYYDNITEFMCNAVNIVMCGVVSTTGDLLTAVLNVSKNAETNIITNVLAKLSMIKKPQDLINDSVDRPTA